MKNHRNFRNYKIRRYEVELTCHTEATTAAYIYIEAYTKKAATAQIGAILQTYYPKTPIKYVEVQRIKWIKPTK